MVKKVRLYSEATINLFQPINLPPQSSHYLFNVMRRKAGDKVVIFDGMNGEFDCVIKNASKTNVSIEPLKKLSDLNRPKDIWLAFTPVKKVRTDFVIEKSTEIGVQKIFPIISEYTTNRRVRSDKLRQQSIEAAEQCGGNFIPEIADISSLDRFICDFPKDRTLIFCNEVEKATMLGKKIESGVFKKACILIGPEGGFSDKERAVLSTMNNSISVSLGASILRTETAVISALAIWTSKYSA